MAPVFSRPVSSKVCINLECLRRMATATRKCRGCDMLQLSKAQLRLIVEQHRAEDRAGPSTSTLTSSAGPSTGPRSVSATIEGVRDILINSGSFGLGDRMMEAILEVLLERSKCDDFAR